MESVGRSVKVWINGGLVNRGFNAAAARGEITLQSGGYEVEFRKVSMTRITRLKVKKWPVSITPAIACQP